MIKYDEYYIYNTLHFSLGSMLEFRYITDFVEPPKRRTRRKHGLIFDISKTRSGWTVEQSAGSLGRNDGDIFQPPGLWPSLIFKHWQYVTMLLYIVACWTDRLIFPQNQCFWIILWLQCCFTPQDSVMLAEEVIFKPRLRAQHADDIGWVLCKYTIEVRIEKQTSPTQWRGQTVLGQHVFEAKYFVWFQSLYRGLPTWILNWSIDLFGWCMSKFFP